MVIRKGRISELLGTVELGKVIEVHEWLPSTNDRLLSKIKDNDDIQTGYVVVCEEQRAGRGRQGREWHSPPGGVYMSVLFGLREDGKKWNLISLLVAIAVYDACLTLYGLRPTIKWPNDLLLKRKKLSGILVETTRDEEGDIWAVIGVGINANIISEEFTKELGDTSTSLMIELGEEVELEELIAEVLNNLEVAFNNYRSGDFNLYNELDERETVLGRSVRLISGDEIHYGNVIGFGYDGSIMLDMGGGLRREFRDGSIELMD
jgi:BirA family biotin operon repressor/biotin-[acetyl-CoA-carboxylase] ligase